MTLNELAYNLLNLLRAGRSSNDEQISLSQIKFNIKHYRAMFIRRDYARNGLVTRHLEQSLGCLDLIEVDASQCCSFEVGCPIYRTSLKIPRTVRLNFREAITYTGAVNGTQRIPMVEPYEVEYLMYDKYTKRNPKVFMIEDYMYIYNPNGISKINVRGIFEDPEELGAYNCETGVCYDSNSQFPLPADMVSAISAGLLNGELKLILNPLNDSENDRQQDNQQVQQ